MAHSLSSPSCIRVVTSVPLTGSLAVITSGDECAAPWLTRSHHFHVFAIKSRVRDRTYFSLQRCLPNVIPLIAVCVNKHYHAMPSAYGTNRVAFTHAANVFNPLLHHVQQSLARYVWNPCLDQNSAPEVWMRSNRNARLALGRAQRALPTLFQYP